MLVDQEKCAASYALWFLQVSHLPEHRTCFYHVLQSWKFRALEVFKQEPGNKIPQFATPSSFYSPYFPYFLGNLAQKEEHYISDYLRHSVFSHTCPDWKTSFSFSYFLQSLCDQTNVKMAQVIESCGNFSNIHFSKKKKAYFRIVYVLGVEIKYGRIVPVFFLFFSLEQWSEWPCQRTGSEAELKTSYDPYASLTSNGDINLYSQILKLQELLQLFFSQERLRHIMET